MVTYFVEIKVRKAGGSKMQIKKPLFFVFIYFSFIMALNGCSNGLSFDNEDNLYVASILSNAIVALDPENGHILQKLDKGNFDETDPGQSGKISPDDIAFSPEGALFWTNYSSGHVCRLFPVSREAIPRCQFVAVGVNPITFSDDGRLFTALFLPVFADGAYELDPALVKAPRLILGAPGWLNGMDWGPDGFLYAPSWRYGKIMRIDVDSGENETVIEDIFMPAAIKFDSQGHLYALEYFSGRVLKIDIATKRLTVITTLAGGLDNLAFDSMDRLFVSNSLSGVIVEVLADGATRTVSGFGPP